MRLDLLWTYKKEPVFNMAHLRISFAGVEFAAVTEDVNFAVVVVAAAVVVAVVENSAGSPEKRNDQLFS